MSSTWTEREKAEIKAGLVQEAMSPENSEDETLSVDADDSDEDERPTERKIVTSPLAWRSLRFNETLQSLDRKWMRRCSERSRTMVKTRQIGREINPPAPEGLPQWMKRRSGNDTNMA